VAYQVISSCGKARLFATTLVHEHTHLNKLTRHLISEILAESVISPFSPFAFQGEKLFHDRENNVSASKKIKPNPAGIESQKRKDLILDQVSLISLIKYHARRIAAKLPKH